MFSCEIWEIFKNTFFYRTTSVAASAFILLTRNIKEEKNLFKKRNFYINNLKY